LEFDVQDAGTVIQCPHCGMETKLFIPTAPIESPPENPPRKEPEPKTARIIQQTNSDRSMEALLEGVGGTYSQAGIVIGGVALIAALVFLCKAQYGQAGLLIVIGFATIWQGFVFSVLFRAGAEVIRLLKKSNGLKFDGVISGTTIRHSYSCSICAEFVSDRTQFNCVRCGAKFVQP